MSPIRIAAPAKINLFLHVTGKRADGYHLIESLAAFTTFGDVLDIVPAETLSLDITGQFAASLSAQDNLVLKAAKLFRGGRGAQITLQKNIPVGAGLGGGSSDAAATLVGLAKLWKQPIPDTVLQLGADVPACLARAPSWVSGIGEQVTPVSIKTGGWALLANPRVPLLTADVYKRFAGDFSSPSAMPGGIDTFDALIAFIENKSNALEAPALALLPVIGDILSAIRATEGCRLARMSGSGATCFGLYENEKAARQAAQQLQRAHPKWWCMATALMEDTHG